MSSRFSDIGIEVESKFELSRDDFERLRASGTLVRRKEQLNVYYDDEGILSEAAITFRVRFTLGDSPRLTLKIPQGCEGGARRAVEIESDYVNKFPVRRFRVVSDLPSEFAAALGDLGVSGVHRLGWMRTTRWVIALTEDVEVELDRVDLPNGEVFFEAEVEEPESARRERAVREILCRAVNAVPSQISKFERFARTLEDRSQEDGIEAPRRNAAAVSRGDSW